MAGGLPRVGGIFSALSRRSRPAPVGRVVGMISVGSLGGPLGRRGVPWLSSSTIALGGWGGRLAAGGVGAAAVPEPLLVELGAAAQEGQLGDGVDGAARLLVDELAQVGPRLPALEGGLVKLGDGAVVGERVEEAPVVLARLGLVAEAQVE